MLRIRSGVDRFKREIALAARLRHPHIVPVHAAGETNGLPYFTMPAKRHYETFVELCTKEAQTLLNHILEVSGCAKSADSTGTTFTIRNRRTT